MMNVIQYITPKWQLSLYVFFSTLMSFQTCVYLYMCDFLTSNIEGHCTLSPKFSHAIFNFFHIPIPSYQNACYGCENAENLTWDKKNLTVKSFGSSVQTWLTILTGHIYFFTCKKIGQKFRTQCADTLTFKYGPYNNIPTPKIYMTCAKYFSSSE